MKKELRLRLACMCAFLVVFLLTTSKGCPDASDNPDQEMIVGDGWSITGQRGARRGLFDRCEGTDELVYFCYSGMDLIDAYDLEGAYQFTIDLPDARNGLTLIDCVEDLLIVNPALGREVILFRGRELVGKMDVEAAREQGYKATSYDKESRYAITRTHVVSVDGEDLTELFELPEEIRVNLPLVTFTPEQNDILRRVLLVGAVVAFIGGVGFVMYGIFFGFRKIKR